MFFRYLKRRNNFLNQLKFGELEKISDNLIKQLSLRLIQNQAILEKEKLYSGLLEISLGNYPKQILPT